MSKFLTAFLTPLACYRSDAEKERPAGVLGKLLLTVACAIPRPLLYLAFILADMALVWNVGLLLLDYILSLGSWLEHGCGQFEFHCFFTLVTCFEKYFINW